MKSLAVIDQQLADLKKQREIIKRRVDFLNIKSKFNRIIVMIYENGEGGVTFSDFFGTNEVSVGLNAEQIEQIKDMAVKTVMDKLNGEVK